MPVSKLALSDIALMKDGVEVKGMTLRKRGAVHALAKLGDNMNRHFFGKDASSDDKILTSAQKTGIIDKLSQEGSGKDERAEMARYASGVLQKTTPAGVDKVLAECANNEDISLRELVCQALNFWDGPDTEPTLLRLATDRGAGTRILITDDD